MDIKAITQETDNSFDLAGKWCQLEVGGQPGFDDQQPWVLSSVCLHEGDFTTLVTLQSSLVFPLCSVAVPASLFFDV